MKHLLRQTANIYLQGAKDRYGKTAWGSPFTVRCRASKTTRRVIDQTGEEVNADLKMVLIDDDSNLTSLSTGDKVLLEGVTYKVMTVFEGRSDLGREQYKTITLKIWQG